MRIFRDLGSILVPALVLAACSAEPPASSGAACPGGVRPALDECARGTPWADCAGTGEATVFACSEAGSLCYWFAGECVPEGFVASPCPAEDVCCIDDRPFESDRSFAAGYEISSFFYEWGERPWDRTRERTIDVAIVTPSPAPIAITCTGIADADRGPCATEGIGGQRIVGRDVFSAIARSPSIAILFWKLSIEITRDEDESLHARVCRVYTTDVGSDQCGDRSDPECAVSGTIGIDVFPEDATAAATTRVRVFATFADGGTIDAQL